MQSQHVVLYSKEGGMRVKSVTPPEEQLELCPFCKQAMPSARDRTEDVRPMNRGSAPVLPPIPASRYFGLLSETHTPSTSQPPSRPGSPPRSRTATEREDTLAEEELMTGFYDRFFKEEKLLGRGARGAVYLCQHVLHGSELQHYACKKMAVGDSVATLLATLKEIRHLQHLRHPNIISYHHAWLEAASVSRVAAPIVPCLFVLLDFANMGSLASYIEGRIGAPVEDTDSRDARVRRFKAKRSQSPDAAMGRGAMHFLGLPEILKLFRDVCEGLAFIHSHNVLHLDLKDANVLLNIEPDELVPSALLSDFGSAEERSALWQRDRSGFTGTIDFCSPEALKVDAATGNLRPLSVETDLFSIGLILHLLCFLCLPYRQRNDVDLLKEEILGWSGYNVNDDHGRSDLPFWLLRLLSRLLSLEPSQRPSASAVLAQLNRLENSKPTRRPSELIPALSRRTPSSASPNTIVPAKRPPVRFVGRFEGISREQSFAALVLLKVLLLRPTQLILLYAMFAGGLLEVLLCDTRVSLFFSLAEWALCSASHLYTKKLADAAPG